MPWKKLPFAFLFVLLFSISTGMAAYAEPKDPTPQQITQPDGIVITVIERGDEFVSWAEDPDGYLIAFNEETGYWHYAYVNGATTSVTKPGDIIVGINTQLPYGPQLLRGLKHKSESYIHHFEKIGEQRRVDFGYYDYVDLKPLADYELDENGELVPRAPTMGKRMLVVIVEYNDKKAVGTTSGLRTEAQFNDLFLKTGSGVKSIIQYYDDMAGQPGAILPADTSGISSTPVNLGTISTTAGADWVRAGAGVTISSPYNGIVRIQVNRDAPPAYNWSNNLGNSAENGSVQLALRAIQVHSSTVASRLQSYTSSNNLSVTLVTPVGGGFSDGVSTVLGSMRHGAGGPSASLGTFVHEMGHAAYSWPDLYPYSGAGSYEGTGFYCVMSYGMYGADTGGASASTPVGASPYLKEREGWGNIETIAAGQGWTGDLVPYNHVGNRILKVNNSSDSNQYFMVENIAYEGWNAGYRKGGSSSHGGIMITLINNGFSVSGWSHANYVANNNRYRTQVQLANGGKHRWDEWNPKENHFYRSGDTTTFNHSSPGTGNGDINSRIYRTTSPFTRDVATNVSIQTTSPRGTNMTVLINGGGISELTLNSVLADKTAGTVNSPITWTASASGGTGTRNFKFDVYKDNAVVQTGSYGTSNTFTYTPTQVGTYKVRAFVRTGTDAATEKSLDSANITITLPSEYSLSFNNTLNNALGSPANVSVTGTAAYAAGSAAGRNAIRLNHSNYINLGQAFDYNQSFTIAFRVFVESQTGSDPAIFSNKNWDNGANNGFVFQVRSNGDLRLNSKSVSDSGRLNGQNDITLANDIRNRWVHVAAVYNKAGGTNGNVTYYINGVLVGTMNTNLTSGISGGQNSLIGQSVGTASGGFENHAGNNVTFLMEDFILQGGAMTDSQIAALAGIPVTGSGDVNGDGVINMDDLAMLRRYLAASDQDAFAANNSIKLTNADVNGDGVINAADATMLRRQLADAYK